MLLEAEPGEKVKVEPLRLKSGRTLVRKTFSQPEEAVSWLQENPNTYVELTLETDTYLEASVKRQLLQAHDGIVSIRPKLRQAPNSTSEKNPNPATTTLDRTEMFKEYVTQRSGHPPNDSLMELFREITSLET
jgi:exonuclease SbcD